MSFAPLLKPLLTSSLFLPNSRIIFVCGKNLIADDSRRKVFMQYAERNMKQFRFLLAEKVFEAKMHEDIDLLTVEMKISDYADCIIVILESEGSNSELGAFASNNKIAKKVIVMNDISHKYSSSFISKGPIKKIESQRNGFGKPIYFNDNSFLSCIPDLRKKLISIERERSNRIEFTYDKFKKKSKERLLLLYDIIGFLAPVKMRELIEICKNIYGEKEFSFLRTDISILMSLDMICAKKSNIDGNDYFIPMGSFPQFLKISIKKKISIRTNILLHYRRNSEERLNLLIE